MITPCSHEPVIQRYCQWQTANGTVREESCIRGMVQKVGGMVITGKFPLPTLQFLKLSLESLPPLGVSATFTSHVDTVCTHLPSFLYCVQSKTLAGGHFVILEQIMLTSAGADLQAVFSTTSKVLDKVGEFCWEKFQRGEGSCYLDKAIIARRTALKFTLPTDSRRPSLSNDLAVQLSTRYGLLGNTDDVEQVIALHQGILALCDIDQTLRSNSMNNLAASFYSRFLKLGTLADLEEAIAKNKGALELRPPGHLDRPVSLRNLAGCLYTRYENLGDNNDLDEAIVLQRDAMEIGDLDLSFSLNNLACLLFARYNKVGGVENLDEVIKVHKSALELRSVGHPERHTSISNLALGLYTRYKLVGIMDDLEEAIAKHRAALELRPQGHSDRPISFNGLAICLYARFNQLGMMNDLGEAIVMHRDILNLCPPGHHLRSSSLNNLASCLSTRYDNMGEMNDLEEAITINRSLVESLSLKSPYRFLPMHNLAYCLSIRYDKLGIMDDLEEAILKLRALLEPLRPGHPSRSPLSHTLADCLFARYEKLGDASDLEQAMSVNVVVLEALPMGNPLRSSSMDNFGISLSTRYQLMGSASDLQEAIVMHRDALALRPLGHPQRSVSLNNVALCLMTRYEHHGMLKDVEEAIAKCREALELHPRGHRRRPASLDNLGHCLWRRHFQLRVMSDLEDALAMHQEALELREFGDPDRSSTLSHIAICLFDRHFQLKGAGDIEEAIRMNREVLQLRPEGHPVRWIALHNLASSLLARFREEGERSDLEEAITKYRHVLQLRRDNQADRAMTLKDLAHCLLVRYGLLEDMHDLTEAIQDYRAALTCFPVGHPSRAESLKGLMDCLFPLNVPSEIPANEQEEFFDLYSQLSDVSRVVSFTDLEAAKRWVSIAEASSHHSTVLAYQTSLRFLIHHLAILPSLPQSLAPLKEFTSTLSMDAFSACVRHGRLADAVELVEQGRSAFWTQYTRFRSPLDDVVASAGDMGKTLAERFTELSTLLRHNLDSPPLVSPLESPSASHGQHDQVWRLNVQLQDVVEEIRKLPGHSRFLLPLLFSDLRKAAIGGPVIIVNASQYGCDAVIVRSDDDPIHVPLDTNKARVAQQSSRLQSWTRIIQYQDIKKELTEILRELWEEVVSPIFTVLQTFLPTSSRIWWCPTAEFLFLPLHAAGPYRKGQPGSADLYISSYTPTLTTLIRARQNDNYLSESASGGPRFLAVGLAQTPGQKELVSVNGELASIAEIIAPLATFTTLKGEDANLARVGEALRETECVHLACHGIPNRDQRPFESGFALHDGRLKIEDIMRCNLRGAHLAYLSACHTTVGDKESPDEVIHLAAAMHVAGFRSVVGTMWAVADDVANMVASTFYKQMVDEDGRLDCTRAAYALNRTMRNLKQIPLDLRALFVHIGT